MSVLFFHQSFENSYVWTTAGCFLLGTFKLHSSTRLLLQNPALLSEQNGRWTFLLFVFFFLKLNLCLMLCVVHLHCSNPVSTLVFLICSWAFISYLSLKYLTASKPMNLHSEDRFEMNGMMISVISAGHGSTERLSSVVTMGVLF